MASMYEELGVDASKKSVRQIFEKIIDNEYRGAFVNIITDPFCPDRALTQHQDGDGSKFIQRLIHYMESGDESIFEGMVDDALSMNAGDIAASGFVFGPWIITDVLNVNLPKELKKIVMGAIARRFSQLKEYYIEQGFNIKFLGGETADLPDQTRCGVFDICVTAWADKEDIIIGNVKNGDVIFGFPSDGRAAWEPKYNSGIMSNGLTLARSCLMSKAYNEKYPTYKREGAFYKGRFRYNDNHKRLVFPGPEAFDKMSISELLLSPTRQWAIVIKQIMSALKKYEALHMLHGITMNTGGGASKITNLGSGIIYTKKMPTPPPFFKLIQQESGETWDNMYQSFNCGVGIDVVGEDSPIFQRALEDASVACQLPVFRLGGCQKSTGENKVTLNTEFGTFSY